jgi:hypothetical protein
VHATWLYYWQLPEQTGGEFPEKEEKTGGQEALHGPGIQKYMKAVNKTAGSILNLRSKVG